MTCFLRTSGFGYKDTVFFSSYTQTEKHRGGKLIEAQLNQIHLLLLQCALFKDFLLWRALYPFNMLENWNGLKKSVQSILKRLVYQWNWLRRKCCVKIIFFNQGTVWLSKHFCNCKASELCTVSFFVHKLNCFEYLYFSWNCYPVQFKTVLKTYAKILALCNSSMDFTEGASKGRVIRQHQWNILCSQVLTR